MPSPLIALAPARHSLLVLFLPERLMSGHDSLIDATLRANKAALEMRQSLECRIERACDKPKRSLFRAQYWRKGQLIRVREASDDLPVDSHGLYRDGVSLHVNKAPDAKTKQLVDVAVRRAGCDPYYAIDLPFAFNETFFHAGRRDNTLEQFVRAPNRTVKATEIREGPRYIVRLDVELAPSKSVSESGRYEIYVDPSVNYLVRKVIWHMSAERGERFDREVLQYQEAAPGLFVPVKAVHTMRNRGKVEEEIRFSVSDVKVNHEIPASVFKLTIPTGARVFDEIRGVRYDQPAPGAAPTAVEKAPPETFLGVTLRSSSDPGPTSWDEAQANAGGLNTYYAAAILCVVLAAGLVAWRWRRNRAI